MEKGIKILRAMHGDLERAGDDGLSQEFSVNLGNSFPRQDEGEGCEGEGDVFRIYGSSCGKEEEKEGEEGLNFRFLVFHGGILRK